MTRNGFFAAIGGLIAAPFSKRETEVPSLPRNEGFITPEILEDYVRKK